MKMHYFVFKIILFKYIWHREINCIHLKCTTWCFCGYVYIVMEKEMAAHSSILDWRVPWTGEPGRLQSMGLRRARHDRATKQRPLWRLPRWFSGKEPAYLCRRCRRRGFKPLAGKIPWRRKWQPTSVFLPRKSHGQRSLESWSVGSQWVRHNLATENALTLWKDLHSQPK